MKLKQIVTDKSELTLSKERKTVKYGDVFEIVDDKRAKEILSAKYLNKPVAEIVTENKNAEDKQ